MGCPDETETVRHNLNAALLKDFEKHRISLARLVMGSCLLLLAPEVAAELLGFGSEVATKLLGFGSATNKTRDKETRMKLPRLSLGALKSLRPDQNSPAVPH